MGKIQLFFAGLRKMPHFMCPLFLIAGQSFVVQSNISCDVKLYLEDRTPLFWCLTLTLIVQIFIAAMFGNFSVRFSRYNEISKLSLPEQISLSSTYFRVVFKFIEWASFLFVKVSGIFFKLLKSRNTRKLWPKEYLAIWLHEHITLIQFFC